MRQLCIAAAADQYLQVQRRQLLPLLPWVAFVLFDGPGRLTALPIRHAGESQVRVQRAAFHVGLDGGRVRVRREHLLDQVGFLWGFGRPVGLWELVLSLSFSLPVEREQQRGRQGLAHRRRSKPSAPISFKQTLWMSLAAAADEAAVSHETYSVYRGFACQTKSQSRLTRRTVCFDNDANTLGESAERNWRQSAIRANKGWMLSGTFCDLSERYGPGVVK